MRPASGNKTNPKKKRRRSRVIKRKKKDDKGESLVSSNIIKTVKELKKKKTVENNNLNSRKENSENSKRSKPKFKTLKSTPEVSADLKSAGVLKSRSDLESTRDNRENNFNKAKGKKKRTQDKPGSRKTKKFKIGAPSNYERMKNIREKLKKERDKPKIHESPKPSFAFETMYKRSKKLKEFFMDLGAEEASSLEFCRSNWHFLATFESFLVEMVKAYEITKEFNQLNRKTADKIESFIKSKVNANLEFKRNDQVLSSKGFREFNKEMKKYKGYVRNRSEALKGFFDTYQPEIMV